jgi:hypothetical protein
MSKIVLTDIIFDTKVALPFPLSSMSPATHYLVPNPQVKTKIADSANRIYFYCDYNLQEAPLRQQFPVFSFAVDKGISIGVGTQLETMSCVSEDVIGPDGPIHQAPLGGGGTTPEPGTGVNIFDVTDLITTKTKGKGKAVRDAINFNAGALPLFWQYKGYGAIVRRFALYLGHME